MLFWNFNYITPSPSGFKNFYWKISCYSDCPALRFGPISPIPSSPSTFCLAQGKASSALLCLSLHPSLNSSASLPSSHAWDYLISVPECTDGWGTNVNPNLRLTFMGLYLFPTHQWSPNATSVCIGSVPEWLWLLPFISITKCSWTHCLLPKCLWAHWLFTECSRIYGLTHSSIVCLPITLPP